MRPRPPLLLAFVAIALALGAARASVVPPTSTHARPRALAFSAADGLLYVALSTADRVAVVAPSSPPRLLSTVAVCRFPQAVAALPGGGALVGCRFDRGLRRIVPSSDGGFAVRTLAPGLLAGARGLAVAAGGHVAYVASPPLGGVAVVSLETGAIVQELPTGSSPRALHLIAVNGEPRLAVSNFIEHTVTFHPVGADGRLGPAVQTIRTEAPVMDVLATGPARPSLWLLTHEDRPVSRAHGPVEGLDSGVIRLAVAQTVLDPGPGARPFVNLGERAQPVIELEAAAAAADGTIAVAGGGSDNLLLAAPRQPDLRDATTVPVGANPSAVAALPGGRFVTADRLSDTLTFVTGAGRVEAVLSVGEPARTSPADLGELLFYSRALVPHNVATGPLSLYTCAACHADGDRDGRLHPAKQNRFFSTTLTCRGLASTAPFLRLGNQATLDVFADNIVSTHAQGAERDPAHFADYPVTLRVRDGEDWRERTLSPTELRAALSAYMASIPPDPSPFMDPGARALTPQARRGLAVFRGRCAGCHRLVGDTARGDRAPERSLEARLLSGRVALAAAGRMDVGTPVLGEGGNNPPSLRGVWEAAPYFSDGSARTLEEALRRTDPDADAVHAAANAARPPAFSPTDSAALLAFLRAL